jgi:chaperonin GroEL
MSKKPRWQRPGVVFQPAVYEGMQRGINQIVDLVSPTLGPVPRVVMLERVADRNKTPEMLDDGAVIVRRILGLPQREEDVGAMYLRHVLWKMHEDVGDGAATAAVIFREIYNQGVRCIIAGSNAMRLRYHLDQGMRLILDELSGMAFHLEGKEELGGLAETICHDPEMAQMMGEMFDIIGAYGRLEIRSGNTRDLEREYVEGMYWNGGLLSRVMYIDEKGLRVDVQEEAGVLVTDLTIEDPRELVPVLKATAKRGYKALLFIVKKLSDSCIGVLRKPEIMAKIKVLGVKTPGGKQSKSRAFLRDIAVLTGAIPLEEGAGDKITRVTPEHLGRARRVWADRNHFGIIGGMGDPRQLREHIASLRRALDNVSEKEELDELRERIGKLMGGTAILKVGAFTQLQMEERKNVAQRTADAMRAAMREGVIAGGGASLLACRPALQERLEAATEQEERVAYRVLLRAVEAPVRTLLTNSGLAPSDIMGEINRAGSGYAFDLKTQQVVDMAEAGIVDAVAVVKSGVRSAVGSAALALTTDAIVHKANPDQALLT